MAITLEVKPRESGESLDSLRARGRIPAVYYGPKQDSTPISIDGAKLEVLWRDAGETTLITLSGAGENQDTLIRDVQVHPLTGKILHADFYVIEKGKKVEINVPLEFVGEAPAEKQGHIISKALHEISIEVAPAELPHSLEIDLSKLENVGDHILAGDVKLPPSAELKTSPEEMIVSVTEFKEEKDEAATPVGSTEGEAPAAEDAAEASGEESKAA